jgi:MazG family protein
MNDPGRFDNLVAIMDRLRGPDGCPWDRVQDNQTLRGYLLEECYEVADALDRRDSAGLCEELGDLLFQIVFLSRIAKEEGRFTISDVIGGIADKMVRRHPHVFGSATADTAEQVVANWEEIKHGEKQGGQDEPNGKRSLLDGIPAALPALLRAHQLGTRAARVGFDWDKPSDILDKVDEELAELRRGIVSGDPDAAREELGDMLFTLVMLARRLQIDAEGALASTNLKFGRRFRWIEAEVERRALDINQVSTQQMEELWQRAKTEPD